MRPLATWRNILALLIWLALPLAANAQGILGTRLALVIGNSSYQSVYSLKNAVNDASSVADALETLGFKVTLLTDATQARINAAIEAMAEQAAAEDAQATLLYYSGHGFQLGGANYIVPTDAMLNDRDKIAEQTIRLDSIIARLESSERQTIILLDACRDNPLPLNVRGTDSHDGLAEVRTGINTYIAFATAPGAVSLDGKGNQGPFAEAFVRSVSLPDVSVSDMMSVVRTSVRAQTKGMQLPWENNTLFSPFYFNPGTFDPSQMAVQLGPAPQPQPGGGGDGGVNVASSDPTPVTPGVNGPVETSDVVAPNIVKPRPFGEGSVTSVTTGTTVTLQPAADPSQQVADIGPESRSVPELNSPQVPATAAIDASQPALGVGTTQATPGGDGAEQVAAIDPAVPHLSPLDEPAAVIVGVEVTPGAEEPSVPVTPIPEEPVDVALAVQQELKRVGCYTGALDGDWGPRSRAALDSFFDEVSEQSVEGTDATTQVLAMIKARDSIVCERRQVVATPDPPKKKPAQQTAQPRQPQPQQPKAPPKETASQPSPRIQIGVGSGVFR